MKPIRILFCLALITLITSACGQAATTTVPESSPTASVPQTLKVLVHDSFAVSEPVITRFEQENNAKVSFIKGGDAGAALNQAVLTKDAPLADVFYGVDNTFLTRALSSGIFKPYQSPELQNIPDSYKLDPQNRALPVDYGDVCINYDKAYFKDKNLPVPQTLEDLIKPDYKGLLVMENPATSSPGLAFTMATIAHFGQDKYLDYWKNLRDNGIVVVNDWETAYYTNFSGSSGKGPQPMVVSYGSSPVAEVVFASPQPTDSPTASVVGPDTCYRQIEFVGILNGTKNLGLAQKFVDYMLSVNFQEDMPLQMFVYPVNQNAKLPQEFLNFAQMPEQPAQLDPDLIANMRDTWIKDWTNTVLR